MGRDLFMQERFYVAHAPSARVDTSGWDEVEREVLIDHRWWNADELEGAARSFGPDEALAPPNLPALIRPILRGEYPDPPLAHRATDSRPRTWVSIFHTASTFQMAEWSTRLRSY